MPNFSKTVTITVVADDALNAQRKISPALHSIDGLVKLDYGTLAPEETASMWKPIATAPRIEGRKILGFDAHIGIAETAVWRPAGDNGAWIWNGNPDGPTHWMEHPE